MDYAKFLAMPRTRETAQALIDRVMEAMQVQHAERPKAKSLIVHSLQS